jgi:hypothetical protein
MDRGKKERIKTCILGMLVLASIFQVGILLSYRNDGFPLNFLQAFLGTPAISQGEMDDMAREEFFTPYRIVVYSGEGESRWVLGRNNKYFEQLWDETEYYLREVLKSPEVAEIDRDLWEALIYRRSVIFEMKSEIPVSLIKWFLEYTNDTISGIPGIYKVMFAPDESFYRDFNTVYILSGKKLYKAEIPYPAGGMSGRSDYHALMEELKTADSTEAYGVYGATGYPFDIPADMLSSFSSYKRLKHINYSVPESIGNIEHLTGVLLDEYRESYDRSVIDNGIYVFQTLNKMFRVYSKEGVLEYRYNGRKNHLSKDAGKIFSLIYRFIAPKKEGLIPGSQLYLHSVKAVDPYVYRFEFGYRIGDYPVYIQSGDELMTGLVVEATEEQVIYCKWMIRDITFDRVSANYNNNFLTLLDEMQGLHNLAPDELYSSDEGYVLDPDDRSSLEPAWIISTRDGSLYSIPMHRGGAD